MLKVGDRLLCKSVGPYGVYLGKYYTIHDIIDNGEDYDDLLSLLKKDPPLSILYFSQYQRAHRHYIWDYFYTKKEVRKLKLDKLNGIKSRR